MTGAGACNRRSIIRLAAASRQPEAAVSRLYAASGLPADHRRWYAASGRSLARPRRVQDARVQSASSTFGDAPGKATEAVKFDMDRLRLDLGQRIFDPLHGRAIDLADERQREMKTGVVQPAGVAQAELQAAGSPPSTPEADRGRRTGGTTQVYSPQPVVTRPRTEAIAPCAYGASRSVSRSARR